MHRIVCAGAVLLAVPRVVHAQAGADAAAAAEAEAAAIGQADTGATAGAPGARRVWSRTPRPAWAPPDTTPTGEVVIAEPVAPPPAWGAPPAPRSEQLLPGLYITPREPPPRARVELESIPASAASTALAPPPHAPRSRLGRVVLESVGGVVIGAGLAAAGGLIGDALGGPCHGPMLGACTGAILGTSAGALAGVTLGVSGSGFLFDGNGGFGATLLGAAAGGGAGLAGAFLFQFSAATAVLAVALTVAGAVVGYELTSADSRTDAERDAREAQRRAARGSRGEARGD